MINPIVLNVLYAVCVLFGLKPDQSSVKQMLGDPDFIPKVVHYDALSMSDTVHRKLHKYIDREDFKP